MLGGSLLVPEPFPLFRPPEPGDEDPQGDWFLKI